MRPLYVSTSSKTLIKLDDPALRVIVPDQADRLFPLQRISRVIVCGTAIWETDALLACADRGISVTFLDENGEFRARWLGKGNDRHSCLQRLADLLGRPDALELYLDWFKAMERMAIRSTAKKLQVDTNLVVSSRQLHDFFDNQKRCLSIQPVNAIYSKIRGLLTAELIQLFLEAGLSGTSELLQERWLNLPLDFSRLIFWDIEVSLLRWLEKQTVFPEHQEILTFYNGRSARIGYLHAGLLNKLHRWLIEIY